MVRVVDASVGIKWFVREPGSDVALSLLREILDRPGAFAVPELFYYELIHVHFRLFPNPSAAHSSILGRILTLGLTRFSMTPQLAEETAHFQKLGLSGYDGAYAALAKSLKGRWITADRKAYARVAHLGVGELLE